jgi:hypothetical protein
MVFFVRKMDVDFFLKRIIFELNNLDSYDQNEKNQIMEMGKFIYNFDIEDSPKGQFRQLTNYIVGRHIFIYGEGEKIKIHNMISMKDMTKELNRLLLTEEDEREIINLGKEYKHLFKLVDKDLKKTAFIVFGMKELEFRNDYFILECTMR